MSYRKCPGHRIYPHDGFPLEFHFDENGQCGKCKGFWKGMNKIPKGEKFIKLTTWGNYYLLETRLPCEKCAIARLVDDLEEFINLIREKP